MNRLRTATWTACFAVMFSALLFTTALHAQNQGKKEFAFKGKVERIDAKSKTLAVNGENVPGWMGAMTMTYTVDKPDVISTLKVGDEITAKVYEGNFGTLFDVKLAPPKKTDAPKK